jgi:hypothetical protein
MDTVTSTILVEPIATNLWWVLIAIGGVIFILGTVFGRWTKGKGN